MLPITNTFLALLITGGKTPEFNARGYTQIMKETLLKGEENEVSNFYNENNYSEK